MRKTTLACAFLIFCAFSNEAFAVYLYNRTGGTLCVAETRDEPDPFDENVARITEGWTCIDDFGSLHLERSDGMLDVAIKRADGTDYVASCRSLKFPKITSYVPKDDGIDVFGLEILKHSAGWAAYSWKTGSEGEWSSYQTVRPIEGLPAKLDAIDFTPVEAWQFDDQHNGLGYILN